MGYIISYMVLALILLAFIPAIIAAEKGKSFSKWYIFSLLLLPVTFVRVLYLKKPVKIINIYNSRNGKKHPYKITEDKRNKNRISAGYLCNVFFTKLIFSVFASFVALATIRLCVPPSEHLYLVCIAFAILLAIMLSIVEIRRVSKITFLADEITKRALVIFLMSAIISVPMFFISIILAHTVVLHHQFIRFCCTLISFVAFIILLFRSQNYYYAIFRKFFDYCILSVCAYVIFAATTLSMLSMTSLSFIPYFIAMPTQLFNFTYFNSVEYIGSLSVIYGAAAIHLLLVILLFFSGLGCRNYKKKELLERVEYRTKAFRMSQKRILRRHIPKINAFSNPLK